MAADILHYQIEQFNMQQQIMQTTQLDTSHYQTVKNTLSTYPAYFLQIYGETPVDHGWKLSIQGRTLEDSMILYEKLIDLLGATKASFKFASQRLIDIKHPDQSSKLLTVYIPNDVDPKSFAELVWLHIKDYTGGEGIVPQSYTHYKGSIWYRNDRDVEGKYISAI